MINEKMRALGANRSVIRELFEYGRARKAEIGADNVYDFSLGNPSVPAPDEVNESLIKLLTEESSVALHGYTSAQGDLTVREAISKYINETHGESVNADCLYMTAGAAAALTSSLGAVVSAGEEVIVPTPYFPEYKVFVESFGATLKTVATRESDFMLDVDAMEKSITDKCAAIIINSPNNPSGVVYDEENIKALTDMLKRKETELGHAIYLICDEPYRELVYGDVKVPYLTKYYDDTIVCYSFSKSLSIPGDRIGYVLVCPRCRDFTSVYQAICGAGRSLGYVCAPSLLQKLIPYCLGKVSDISVYDDNRRLLTKSLTEYGYDVVKPDGAFYLFIKSPSGDGKELSERAKKFELLLVPSDDFGTPGYVRLSYCVKTEQIERALPALKALIESYKD